MENIDDFMRQKFNNDPDAPGARFEFREEYWEQAQALIEADEARRRKRRRRLLWWLFAGLLAAVAGGYGIRQSDLHQKTGANKPEQQITGVRMDRENPVQAEDTAGMTGPEGSGSADADASKPGVSPANQALSDDQNEQLQSVDYQNAKSKKGATASSSAISVSPRDRHTPIKENNIRQAPALHAAPESNKPGQQGAGVGETYRKENAAETGGEKTAPSIANNTTSGTDSSQTGVNGVAPAELSLENFPFIPTFLRFLKPLPRKPDISKPQPAPDIIRPVHDPRFAFGIQASASWYQPSPDKRLLGGTGGVFARYRLGADWSLSAGAQWRFLPGNWSGYDSLSSEQVRYSFGFKQDYWKLENRGLHFIEIPLGIGWKHRNLRFEGGLAPALLLGAQANLIRRHLESLQGDAHADGIVEKKRIWTDKAPYRAFYIAGFAGVEWQVTQHWAISARGFYRPADLLKPTDVDKPGGGQWWLDTGLSWRF
ncbi:MAG: hypothetical protein KA165_01465 [Saprospiraceae bacterium]|nr:hypothetical protein [Saprospiraceae bacterium]